MRPLSPAPRDPRAASLLRAAFNDVHGVRLHGFALVLTVGDRAVAARIAAQVMAGGRRRVAELRHPERAAAWLRAEAYRAVRRDRRRHGPTLGARRATLTPLGIAPEIAETLLELSIEQRAALIARNVEGFEIEDVATIIGRRPEKARAILRIARRTYLVAAAARLSVARGTAGEGYVAFQIEAAAAFAVDRGTVSSGR